MKFKHIFSDSREFNGTDDAGAWSFEATITCHYSNRDTQGQPMLLVIHRSCSGDPYRRDWMRLAPFEHTYRVANHTAAVRMAVEFADHYFEGIDRDIHARQCAPKTEEDHVQEGMVIVFDCDTDDSNEDGIEY